MQKLDSDKRRGIDRETIEPWRRQRYHIAKNRYSPELTTNAVIIEWPTEDIICGVD